MPDGMLGREEYVWISPSDQPNAIVLAGSAKASI